MGEPFKKMPRCLFRHVQFLERLAVGSRVLLVRAPRHSNRMPSSWPVASWEAREQRKPFHPDGCQVVEPPSRLCLVAAPDLPSLADGLPKILPMIFFGYSSWRVAIASNRMHKEVKQWRSCSLALHPDPSTCWKFEDTTIQKITLLQCANISLLVLRRTARFDTPAFLLITLSTNGRLHDWRRCDKCHVSGPQTNPREDTH